LGEEELITLTLKWIEINNEKRELPKLVLEHNHNLQIAYIPFEHQLVFSQFIKYPTNHQMHVEFYF
tara:strand:- start:323 stop:520 length:198 start_codon:yes stop_codon:yes gene_type:complete